MDIAQDGFCPMRASGGFQLVQEPLQDRIYISDIYDDMLIVQAARDFPGWITVTAYALIRNMVLAFSRVVCKAKALFNRRFLSLPEKFSKAV